MPALIAVALIFTEKVESAQGGRFAFVMFTYQMTGYTIYDQDRI